MTEQDFFKQIWRAYDKVTFDDNIKARVINVCFPTRSVKVSMQDGTQDWVRCERIVSHKSQNGTASDEDGVVENMFKELTAADEKIKKQSEEIKRLQENIVRLQESKEHRIMNLLYDLHRSVNEIGEGVTIKKKKLEQVEQGLQGVEEIMELLKGGSK